MRSDNYYSKEDPGSAGWLVFSLFFPFIGFILWLAWSRVKPNSSRMAGMGLLLGLLFYIVVFGLLIGFLFLSETSTSQVKNSNELTSISQIQRRDSESVEKEMSLEEKPVLKESSAPETDEGNYTISSVGRLQSFMTPMGDQWGSRDSNYIYGIDLDKLYHKFWFVNQQASTHGFTTHYLLTNSTQSILLGYLGTEPNAGHQQQINRRRSAISIQNVPTKEISIVAPSEKTVKVNTEITIYEESPKDVQEDIIQTGTVIEKNYLYVTKKGELVVARRVGPSEDDGFQQWSGYMYDDSTYWD